ncbi:MAG TPA: PA0069 family radical SAM protein [Leptospiraceae bacterium]|nr:PA0069 family radical SAM protein [Leptospiraceae bacterium]HMY65115.1 PA0069 family radical SAM protein [Leptospiraceae bacterium]HMZ58770.1 PA0069 family radical SAM protein [Leptospiraceae bacterium]HNH07719.1 PA0069 family radical SAM protein [Leptospiraceae bacterium]HNI25539.1 PA0069 family radical SAM protein [Leptospiraceae bacterium]
MRSDLLKIQRRGAGINLPGRFDSVSNESFDDGWEIEEEKKTLKTEIFFERAGSILNQIDSPDIPFEMTLNPYRGCEHGCIYCYARPNHGFMNLSPGLDFETKIFAKKDAARLLEKEFSKKNYIPKIFAIGSATDAYQPIEKKLRITRSILQVCLDWKHPAGIITKSSLIAGDMDILSKLAEENLIRVSITVTTLNPELQGKLEPRTASPKKRLETVRLLSQAGIPVSVMFAPLIPGLNDEEMETVLEKSKEAGAENAGYVVLRLPFEVKDIFWEFIDRNFPEKKKKIQTVLHSLFEGKDYSPVFGERMSGVGKFAKLYADRFRLAVRRLELNRRREPLSLNKFRKIRDSQGQMSLFQ